MLTYFYAAKQELVALVNSYATRVFDEDIKMSEDLGGNKISYSFTSVQALKEFAPSCVWTQRSGSPAKT